jgi:hypothetical protein
MSGGVLEVRHLKPLFFAYHDETTVQIVFSNKILTSSWNGELVKWDLNKQGPSKVGELIIAFSFPFGLSLFLFLFILNPVFLLLGRSPMVEVKLCMYVDLRPSRTIGIHV